VNTPPERATLEARPIDGEVRALVRSLATSHDQIVFLEQAASHLVRCKGPQDFLTVLEAARVTIGSRAAALHVQDRWLAPVPDWLIDQPKPSKRRRELEAVGSAQPPRDLLAIPFQGGWAVFWGKPGGFEASDMRLAEALTNLLANALQALEARASQAHNERREHEQALATRIWRTIVSEELPEIPHYRRRGLLRPARGVGGDYYLIADEWLLLGDISGKGIPAALFAGMFVSTLRIAVRQPDVGSALEHALHPELERSEMFSTLIGMRLDADGHLAYFNLGHPPALIRRTSSGQIETLPATAPPMGVIKMGAYPTREVQLEPGDMVVVYSDGITEARREMPDGSSVLFGEERLRNSLMRATTPEAVLALVNDEISQWVIEDDLSIVAVQYQPEVA
jgi:phosphoserine phosphatase RsbU/P